MWVCPVHIGVHVTHFITTYLDCVFLIHLFAYFFVSFVCYFFCALLFCCCGCRFLWISNQLKWRFIFSLFSIRSNIFRFVRIEEKSKEEKNSDSHTLHTTIYRKSRKCKISLDVWFHCNKNAECSRYTPSWKCWQQQC